MMDKSVEHESERREVVGDNCGWVIRGVAVPGHVIVVWLPFFSLQRRHCSVSIYRRKNNLYTTRRYYILEPSLQSTLLPLQISVVYRPSVTSTDCARL